MEKQNYLFLNQADLLAKKAEFDKYMTQLRTMYAEMKSLDVFNFQNNATKGAVDNLMIFENTLLEFVKYQKKSFETFNHFTTRFFTLVPGYNTTMTNGFSNTWKDSFNKFTEAWESSLRENIGLNTELSIGLIQLTKFQTDSFKLMFELNNDWISVISRINLNSDENLNTAELSEFNELMNKKYEEHLSTFLELNFMVLSNSLERALLFVNQIGKTDLYNTKEELAKVKGLLVWNNHLVDFYEGWLSKLSDVDMKSNFAKLLSYFYGLRGETMNSLKKIFDTKVLLEEGLLDVVNAIDVPQPKLQPITTTDFQNEMNKIFTILLTHPNFKQVGGELIVGMNDITHKLFNQLQNSVLTPTSKKESEVLFESVN